MIRETAAAIRQSSRRTDDLLLFIAGPPISLRAAQTEPARFMSKILSPVKSLVPASPALECWATPTAHSHQSHRTAGLLHSRVLQTIWFPVTRIRRPTFFFTTVNLKRQYASAFRRLVWRAITSSATGARALGSLRADDM